MDTQRKGNIAMQGYRAQRAGVKWWHNPYKSGGRAAYAWDSGHTAGRRSAHLA